MEDIRQISQYKSPSSPIEDSRGLFGVLA